MHDRSLDREHTARDLGLTLCRDGQIERGAEELRKALALNPQDRDAAKALEAIRVLNKTE
jgi:Flp pilus assembly protein TadD